MTGSLGHHRTDWPTPETVVFCGVNMLTLKFTELKTVDCSKKLEMATSQLPLV